MSDVDLSALYILSQGWAARVRSAKLQTQIKIYQLPKSSYDGDNPYNGFIGAERRRSDQVIQVLRRCGIVEKPTECDLCGSETRITFHAEDYFDPFALIRICFPCHMSLHARFKSPAKWMQKLEQHSERPYIAEFRALPMQEVNFAGWLRDHTLGPHDVIKAIWPEKIVKDYSPRTTQA